MKCRNCCTLLYQSDRLESELSLLQSKDDKVTDYTERISEQFVTQFRTYQDDLNEQLISPLSGNLTRYRFKYSVYGVSLGRLSLFAVTIITFETTHSSIITVNFLCLIHRILMIRLSIKYSLLRCLAGIILESHGQGNSNISPRLQSENLTNISWNCPLSKLINIKFLDESF